jgi:hypothetical protein
MHFDFQYIDPSLHHPSKPKSGLLGTPAPLGMTEFRRISQSYGFTPNCQNRNDQMSVLSSICLVRGLPWP